MSTQQLSTQQGRGEPPAAPVLPGLGLAVAVAVVATVVGRLVPVVGGPVAGVLLGVALAGLARPRRRFTAGIAVGATTILQASVVVLGSQLSLGQVLRVGSESLPVLVGTLAAGLLAAYWFGRWLGVTGDLRTLIGVGTGVCGASAIAAVAPVIGAVGADVAYAVSTIFLFNVAAVLAFPLLGHLLGLSQQAFGLFVGTAVNDLSSVVATATTYGAPAATYAIVVKLTRTLFIIPISLTLAAITARRARGVAVGVDGLLVASPRLRIGRLVPPFLLGFLAVAGANSLSLVPAALHPALGSVSLFLITVALSAVGLSTDVAGLRRAGVRPVLLGGSLWLVVGATSLGLQRLTGTL